MDQIIVHACGHKQLHYLTGFTSQQDRKARWLETTQCRTCFAEVRQAEQRANAARDDAAIARLALPQLTGSDRQITWATTIRTGRLASMLAGAVEHRAEAWIACLPMTDAKWWIDHRDLTVSDLIAKAENSSGIAEGQAHEQQGSTP
ncbi:MAG: hypothetical protein EOO77_03415 [Oxalobacteraceae bacterium]|jgi:hypothetical protein|nr:MAG: hypothetical protein EOO77_03415 [Oxalobacteraceae bacterium]